MALNKKAVKIEINNNHTFVFYQKNYKVNLELYLKNYIDNNESTFIDEQIWSYKQYLFLQENGTMTDGKRQSLLDDLEHTKTIEQLRQSTLQIIEFLKAKDLKAKFEQPQQFETVITDEVLLKNEYITIFKNDLGFSIFTKMFELYKTEKTDLANFSFLFFAMNDDYLVCSQTDFVKFLEIETYNISIEKIDNRQWKWQINKKSKH